MLIHISFLIELVAWFCSRCKIEDIHRNTNFLRNKREWVIMRHSLMLLWFADLMNVTEEVTIHRPNVSTLLSSALTAKFLAVLRLSVNPIETLF